MQYLGLALYAEGSTDYQFLCPLLLRLCESACAQATQPVEIGGGAGCSVARQERYG